MDNNHNPIATNASLPVMRLEPVIGNPVTMGGVRLNESRERGILAEQERASTREKDRKRAALNVSTVVTSMADVQGNGVAQATVTQKMHDSIEHQRKVQNDAGDMGGVMDIAGAAMNVLHGIDPVHAAAETAVDEANDSKKKKPMRPTPYGGDDQ